MEATQASTFTLPATKTNKEGISCDPISKPNKNNINTCPADASVFIPSNIPIRNSDTSGCENNIDVNASDIETLSENDNSSKNNENISSNPTVSDDKNDNVSLPGNTITEPLRRSTRIRKPPDRFIDL